MSRRKPSRFNGLLPVYKKTGPTSHDVVDIARRSLRERRIGHTGTLDPMAEGLLLLCIGKATRLQQYLLQWNKAYRGLVRLGWATDTYDAEGRPIGDAVEPAMVDLETLAGLESKFSGTFEQTPPSYSAKKVGGKKLYELARSGQEVSPEPKTVDVQSLSLSQENAADLVVDVEAGSGFYVRSLAHDLGRELGFGGHLRRLERTRIGPFLAEDAIPQDALEQAPDAEAIVEGPHWIALADLPLPFPGFEVNPTAASRFTHGQEIVIVRKGGAEAVDRGPVAVRSAGELLGVGEIVHVVAQGRTVTVRPSLVLAPQAQEQEHSQG